MRGSELASQTQALLGILGRNTLWLWLDLGALRIGTLLAGLFLIRYLGPANFGVYSTAIAAGWLVNAVLDLGLTRYTARAVAANVQEAPRILALSLFLTASSMAIQILAAILAFAGGDGYLACVCAGLVVGNLEGTASLCSSMLTADLRSKAILPGSLLGATGLIGIMSFAIWQHFSVLVLLAAISVKSLAVVSMRLWQLRRHWPTRPDWRWGEFQRLARRAWPFFTYNLTQVGYGKISIVCFGLVATQEKVGWFSAAFALSDIFPTWSYASSGALLPLLTRLFESRRMAELLNLRQRLLDVLLFLSVPVGVLFSVFAPQVCQLLGARFASSAPVLRIIAYRSLLSVLDGFLGHSFLIAINRVRERQKAQAKALLLLAALTLLLGRLWGPTGAALALFIADSTLILQYLRTFSELGLRISWPAVGPTLVAGTAMAITGLRLPQTMDWALKPAPALLVYLGVLSVLARGRLITAGRTLRECFTGG